jgi:thiamine biosynthesis lipoprotein
MSGGRDEPAARVHLEAPGGLGGLHRFSHEAMATVYEVYAAHDNRSYAAQAAQACFDLVDRLEQELSRFRPNSDVTRINHLDAGDSTPVGTSTLECLVIARHIYGLTGGAFDVSIGTGLPSLELDAVASTVRASGPGVRIDLGGIGKGYAVDVMAELLEEWDVPVALVHGGFSSMIALDPPAGHAGWPLTLSDPSAPSTVLARLSVGQAALGASGVRKGDHIVDPRTNEPARQRRAAWVTLPRPRAERDGATPQHRPCPAAVADALTTACMLLDRNDIQGLCANNPGLAVWTLEGGEFVHFGATR